MIIAATGEDERSETELVSSLLLFSSKRFDVEYFEKNTIFRFTNRLLLCKYVRWQVHLFLTDWPFSLLQGALVHDVAEHWQQEGDGFSAASLGDADQVSATHDSGDGLGLDGGGLLVAVPEDVNQTWVTCLSLMVLLSKAKVYISNCKHKCNIWSGTLVSFCALWPLFCRSNHQSDSLLQSIEDLHWNAALHPGLDGLGAALSFHRDPFQFQSVCSHIWIHEKNKVLVMGQSFFFCGDLWKKELFIEMPSPRFLTVSSDKVITTH